MTPFGCPRAVGRDGLDRDRFAIRDGSGGAKGSERYRLDLHS